MTNEHTSLEKYTSHTLFSKGLRKGWCWLCVRGELETGTDCNILTPSSSDHSSTSFSFSWAAQPGVTKGHKPSVCKLILTLASYLQLELQLELQLTQAVCGTWLYNCLSYICFLWASTGQGEIPISSTGCTSFLIDGWVEGQYVTLTLLQRCSQCILQPQMTGLIIV